MVKKITYIRFHFFLTFILMSYFFVCVIEQTTFLSKLQKIFILVYFIFIFYLIMKKLLLMVLNIKHKIIIWLFALMIVIMFRNQFIPKIYSPTDITIIILKDADERAIGKEAWLTSIYVNGTNQKLSSFIDKTEKNSWTLKDNILFGDATQGNNELSLHFSKVKSIQLNFVKHPWSGVIEITINDSKYKHNLYDEVGDELRIDIPVLCEEYSIFQRVILLLGASLIIFYLFVIVFSKSDFFSGNIEKKKEQVGLVNRFIGIDIVKTIAIFFVISVHFFLNTNFYTTSLFGEVMHLQLMARWLFFTCVPLFLLSTGYLQKEKTYNLKYWKTGYNILISYISISIVALLYRVSVLKEEITIWIAIKRILNFSLNGYAWYVAMFIGLYMLIPAINIIYKNIGNKRNRLNFILILCFLTAIPVNGFLSNEMTALYPITYYFIGSYIREYTPKINKIKGIIWIFLFIFLEDLITIFIVRRNGNNIFSSIFIDRYGFIFNLCVSVIIFLLLYDIKRCPIFIQRCFTKIAQSTFEIYLFSFIFDSYFYTKFKSRYFITQQDFSKYYFIIVPLVFCVSFTSANIYLLFKQLFLSKR